jgi:hypothetical protein
MPVIQGDNTVQVQSNKAADLTAKEAGDLALAKIDLFTNNRIPTPLDVIGDYTLPTFTGYVQKAFAGFTAEDLQPDGTVTITATNVVSWVGPADATGQVVQGYLIRAAAGGALIAAAKFPAPVSLMVPTDVLDLVATYTQR